MGNTERGLMILLLRRDTVIVLDKQAAVEIKELQMHPLGAMVTKKATIITYYT